MSQTARQYYTPDEVATLTGYSVKSVYKAIQLGDLPATRARGMCRLRVRVEDVLLWMHPEPQSLAVVADVIPLRRAHGNHS